MKRTLGKIIRKILAPAERARARRIDRLVGQYREWDTYEPDVIRTPAQTIHVPQVLPSEPPEGIDYRFCATGYFTRGRNPEVCSIPTEWRLVDNYCHWMLCELPLMSLALESGVRCVELPRALLKHTTAFQVRSWNAIRAMLPNAEVTRLRGRNGILPVNHDTSTSVEKIGLADYRHYHHARATPYAIELLAALGKRLERNSPKARRFYINRATRQMANEDAVQQTLRKCGFQIVSLETMTLDEQAQLFHEADTIVGFHGAGFTNLVFSGSQARVVEIADSECVSPVYLDGISQPGKRATRTYFHMIAWMKALQYCCFQTDRYICDHDRLVSVIDELEGR